MGSVTCWSGAWKTCPSCGKLFYVTDCERWAYKRNVSEKGNGEVKHFCKWSCLLKFDREYEEAKRRKRSESAKEQHKRQKQKEGEK